jgi:hypothetical protein
MQLMETGPVGRYGQVVQQRAARPQSFVRLFIDMMMRDNDIDEHSLSIVVTYLGLRNCTGAVNGGTCLGSSIDTQLCYTNVTCTRTLQIMLVFSKSMPILINSVLILLSAFFLLHRITLQCK